MTNWTAQTRENRISVSSYAFEDNTISGFIGTHQPPSGWRLRYVTLTPTTTSNCRGKPQAAVSPQRRDHVARYYSVLMDAGASRQIRTEITAPTTVGPASHVPAHSRASVVVEATRTAVMGFVRIDPAAREIVGYNPDRMDN